MALKKTKVTKPKTNKINPKEILKEKKSLAEQLSEPLEDKGVIFFVPVDNGGTLNIDIDNLSLPSDLTVVTSRDLGNYLNAFTQQKAYMRTVFSMQCASLEEAKRTYYEHYIEVYRELTEENPKMSEKAKELYCNNHDSVYNSYMEYRNAKEQVDMVDMTIESLTEFIFLISREISRRGADWNDENRISNLK